MALVEIYEKKVKFAHCTNCDYHWQVRIERTPRSCPRCKTSLTQNEKK